MAKIVTSHDLTSKASEVVSKLNSAYFLRHQLLRDAAMKMDKDLSSIYRIKTNGHRVIIGFCFKSIRESCRITLEEMSIKCDLACEIMEGLENRGFLSFITEKICHVGYSDSLTKSMYVAYLKTILHENWIESSEEFCFDDIYTLATAYIRDIKDEIMYADALGNKRLEASYRNIRKSYDEIQDIIAPYIEY